MRTRKLAATLACVAVLPALAVVPDNAATRFVRTAELGESAMIAYAAVARMQSERSRANCEADVFAQSADIFELWAVTATLSVFDYDFDARELDRLSDLLQTPVGRQFVAARSGMIKDLANGVSVPEARARANAKMPQLTAEIREPVRRIVQIGRLLEDPVNFKQWPRYAEFTERLRRCGS